ncbi:AAA family ATPase [Streptomyces sp. NBC_00201]|uniref:AAA family ATPase n=1 Tax=Streptomyces sp. NBC_00201 TaxID=2975679 RepID=UPI0022543154|nr:AAA family ATPase [Streptomyces sp. NBC_00201]MCX5246682.1 AAA family ATPase [Streptomyces sp. NBC_00201]
MYLKNFSVNGFRSLRDVSNIPVSKPTILAGHNDGGKSALLDALSLLVGTRTMVPDDRSYIRSTDSEDKDAFERCTETVVVGEFTLDGWEQQEFDLPSEVRLRRRIDAALDSSLEIWSSLPNDDRLADLAQYLLPELKELAAEFDIKPDNPKPKKADFEKCLRDYGRKHSDTQGWLSAPSGLQRRMPRILIFDGKAARPDDAVKTALSGKFQAHMADASLQGKLQAVEDEVKERLRIDAKSLCDHIKERCPDLAEVFVEPDVSFQRGFNGAPLRISRVKGASVGLDRSGLGSNRRVSLAVWEWTSELLADEEAEANANTSDTHGEQDSESEPPPVQTIVIYDEPDTHLDYHHQRKVMGLIRKQAAIPHVGVMVATHSMNLIDGVDISDVVHLKLENLRTIAERIGADELGEAIDLHLGKIAAALGLRNSVLLHERCFLAVEGETEQRAFPLLFRLCEGLSLQAAGVALWACFNNEGALHLARYLVKQGRTVLLVVDADSRTLPKSIFKDQKLREHFGPNVADYVKFIGETDDAGSVDVPELEALFGDDLWASVANDAWPRNEGVWTPADFAALRSEKKFSAAVEEMLQTGSDVGPGGKPDMMYRFALALKDAEQVPEQLRQAFAQVRKLAE